MMNQTKKRLTIINLAISMTDEETIRDQIVRLDSLKSDEKLQEILRLLRAQNYGQAQRHIQTYLETDNNVIVQRTAQAEEDLDKNSLPEKKEDPESIISRADQDIIDQFDLFVTSPETQKDEPKEEKSELKIDDFLSSLPQKKSKTMPEVDFNTMLDIHVDDVMEDNIELDASSTSTDTFFKSEMPKEHFDTEKIAKDNFYIQDEKESEEVALLEIEKILEADDEEKEIEPPIEIKEEIEEEVLRVKMPTSTVTHREIPMDDISVQKETAYIDFGTEEDLEEGLAEEVHEEELPPPIPVPAKVVKEAIKRPVINYKSIAYIEEKFLSMQHRHPILDSSAGNFS
jgi:hypothetical protein